MKSNFFKIGKKYVGKGNKVFIVAEIGVNHEGSFSKCTKLFEEAKLSGADAVKIQTVDVEKNYVQGTASYNEFKNTDFTNEEFYKLSLVAKKLSVSFFTTPGDFESVDKCKKYGSQAIKISSGLITHLPLIEYASKKKLPIIISTGMAFKHEIKEALNSTGANKKVVLLKCTSLYPSPDNSLNIKSIAGLRRNFQTLVGYSDHTLDDLSCVSAVAAGAKVIEKHFTLNKKRKGKDHKISLEPEEFKIMVSKIRRVETIMGKNIIRPNIEEIKNRKNFHRCIVAAKTVYKNEKFTSYNIALKRPKFGKSGLEPKFYNRVIGKINKKKIFKDQVIKISNLK